MIKMPRPKKDGRYLNLYLDRALHEEFEQFCKSLGQTKTLLLKGLSECIWML